MVSPQVARWRILAHESVSSEVAVSVPITGQRYPFAPAAFVDGSQRIERRGCAGR